MAKDERTKENRRSNKSSQSGIDDRSPKDFGHAFVIGIVLNVVFVAVEAGYGFASKSLALIADSGHNLSDVLGLAIAWVAVILSRKSPTARFTYGLRKSSILSALFSEVFLLVAYGTINLEAFQRFGDPRPVAGLTVILVAAVGIVINVATALLLSSGRKGDINVKGAFLPWLRMPQYRQASSLPVLSSASAARTGSIP